jgi:hypothetical protein
MDTILCVSSDNIDWPAWIEAIAVSLTLIVAVILPFVERALRRKEEKVLQTAALIAIAERAEVMMARLQRRAHKGSIERSEYPWLSDEASAITKVAESVDLTSLKDNSLAGPFGDIQEAARTAKRRLGTDRGHAQAGSKTFTVQTSRFDEPANKVAGALAKLRARLAQIRASWALSSR